GDGLAGRQLLHLDLAELDNRLRRAFDLQGEMALLVPHRLVDEIDRRFAIDFDDGPIALRDDLQGEPSVRFDKIRCDLSQRVQAAGLERILSIALEYLRFVALGVDAPSEAIFRAKVHTAVPRV